jgi:hypothetical protein
MWGGHEAGISSHTSNLQRHRLGSQALIEAAVMKCNACKKPTIFEIEYGWDVPVGVVIAECQSCYRKGARLDEDIMDKQVERCQLCGGWKMEFNKCGACKE